MHRRFENLDDPKLFFKRELSTLAFNERVLAQAQDPEVPLLERIFFLSISCSNLDEFFEVRVASLMHQIKSPYRANAHSHTNLLDLLATTHEKAGQMVHAQYHHWNSELRPELAQAGIHVLEPEDWNASQRQWLHSYFENHVKPVLSPLGLDRSHPFPLILNKSLNIVVSLKGTDAFGREGHMAVIRVPRSLPRIVQLPNHEDEQYRFVLLSSLLSEFAASLFPGMEVTGAHQFRVTRSSELFLDDDDDDDEDLANVLRDELREREDAIIVRLELDKDCPEAVAEVLMREFEINRQAVYFCDGPVNLNRIAAVRGMVDRPELMYPPFQPRPVLALHEKDPFPAIARQDILLHHPYDEFTPVVELLRAASHDPSVLAIKQTLYRTGVDSKIVRYLCDAARNRKNVTVVIELLARFDEIANIELANELQDAGVQIVYGVVGYKTHSKMLLIIRRERGELQYYTHLSTGNYHSGTAKAYTDIGLLTANRELGDDVNQVFAQLSGLAPDIRPKHVLQAPFRLKQRLIELIHREANHASSGKSGRIIARMNALNELDVIRALYRASQAGVQIDLIVRGHCLLRPGIEGLSENIRVRSIIGRFLEHTRAFWFANDGDPVLYGSSADWMGRNLNRRVELAFPFLDAAVFERVYHEALEVYLKDNVNAWILQSDGSYTKCVPEPGQEPFVAQRALMKQTTI